MTITNHRLDGAEWRPTPNLFGWIKPSLIVVHETGTRITKGSAVKYCTTGRPTNPVRVAYHVIIERDGTIVQLAAFNRKLRHAGKSIWKGRKYCNQYSVGIGLVGPTELKGTAKRAKSFYGKWFEAEDGLVAADSPHHGRGHIWLKHTPEQMAALDTVVSEMREAYPGIDICAHWGCSPGRKIDTSPLVDIASIGKPKAPELPEKYSEDAVQQLAQEMDDLLEATAEPASYEMTVEPTAKTLAKTSREYRTVDKLKAGAVSVAAGTGILEAASTANVTAAKSYLDIINAFISSYGVPMLIGGCVAIWAGGELVQYYKRESYDAGLYEPSGEDGEAT